MYDIKYSVNTCMEEMRNVYEIFAGKHAGEETTLKTGE
jgi:hypothetical protein